MRDLFERLLESAVGEVVRREGGYFAQFPLTLPPFDGVIEGYLSKPVFATEPRARVVEALSRGESYLSETRIPVARKAGEPDPVARVMLDSMMDAFAAEQGDLPLRPEPDPSIPLSDMLAEEYDHRETEGGVRYLIRRRGERPLLLLNAIGIPLALWTKLLTDRGHDLRVIIVESRSTDLLSGGVQGSTDLATDTADIAMVLEQESIEAVDVLGWSNGARIAINLAFEESDRIRSLLLLGPTLSGIKGVSPVRNVFESSLQDVFLALHNDATLAKAFVGLLGARARPPDWAGMADDPGKRAETLFALPATEYGSMLLVPMAREDELINYGRRITADIGYPIHQALASLRIPVLLITGQYDNVISNSFAIAAITAYVPRVTHVNVKGAGHYIHDLQYPHFRWLLETYLADLKKPISTHRLDVQILSSANQVACSELPLRE